MQKIFRETKWRLILEERNILDFPTHIHEDIEVVFIKKGKGVACCDGKKYNLKENSFFIAFPNQVHYYEDFSIGRYLILIIKAGDLLGYNKVFFEGVPDSSRIEFENNDDDGIIELLETAKNEFERDGRSTIIDAYLTAFFGKLLKRFEIRKNENNSDTVIRIIDYCSSHFKENISLNSVAKDLHLSRSTVSHVFSSKLTLNFCDYINSLRLTEAVKLLKNRDYSITEISYMSGFTTIRTFNRAFIKRYGVTPTQYKKTMS